jgi:hypothetical protein
LIVTRNGYLIWEEMAQVMRWGGFFYALDTEPVGWRIDDRRTAQGVV